MSSVIHVVNPYAREWTDHRYVLWFGAYADTRLMIWADSLEDALEDAATWLADHAPGHLMQEWSDEHKDLIKEVCEERGVQWPEGFEKLVQDAHDGVSEDAWDITQDAEADLTRTESGFLTSYEWGIYLEDPTRAELMAFAKDMGAEFAYE